MTTGAFWTFSVGFYNRKGAEAACIALQDTYGADVDVVLFALWCASRGQRLDVDGLAAVDAAISSWRTTVVRPIRQARRALKLAPPSLFAPAAIAALRERLLSAELESERLQHAAMEGLAPPPGMDEPGPTAHDNLACFALHAAIPPDAAPFASLLQAFA